jgi:C-terminal processing protease CtpA/Prc
LGDNIAMGLGIQTSLSLFYLLLAATPFSNSQPVKEPYATGATLVGSTTCKVVFISGVHKDSPAAKAGLTAGDVLLNIDGHVVTDLQTASDLMKSNNSSPIKMGLARNDKHFTATVNREPLTTILRRDNYKLVDGRLEPLEATNSEIMYSEEVERQLESAKSREVVFPGHYPANTNLYYPGFEIFMWNGRITVGGMERGPASRAGVRWGDQVLAIDGVNPDGKSRVELEALLSRSRPEIMRLTINRAGVQHTYAFELEVASTVMRQNNRRMVDGKLQPLWLPERYQNCFR